LHFDLSQVLVWGASSIEGRIIDAALWPPARAYFDGCSVTAASTLPPSALAPPVSSL